MRKKYAKDFLALHRKCIPISPHTLKFYGALPSNHLFQLRSYIFITIAGCYENVWLFSPSLVRFHLDSFVQSPPGLLPAALPEEEDSSYVYTTLPVEVETMDKEQMKGGLDYANWC